MSSPAVDTAVGTMCAAASISNGHDCRGYSAPMIAGMHLLIGYVAVQYVQQHPMLLYDRRMPDNPPSTARCRDAPSSGRMQWVVNIQASAGCMSFISVFSHRSANRHLALQAAGCAEERNTLCEALTFQTVLATAVSSSCRQQHDIRHAHTRPYCCWRNSLKLSK